ncbi:MAG: M24 family metallopeptidase [Acidiferrobacterales bacterium]|nr:M24 family metallopeptidase [Acidiferrobacterales bacterium]
MDVVASSAGDNRRIAVDRCGLTASGALQHAGLEMVEGQGLMEVARSVKSTQEIALLQHSINVGEIAIAQMRRLMEPGITENALWSKLHETNIAMGGEWIETRLLASGARTNPWFHECSMKPIEKGEMVSFDTDMIGPYGYICDMSRSWICGEVRPKPNQARLYQLANEQIHFNIDLLRPGLSFHEFAQMAWPLPDEFKRHRYGVTAHGVGLTDEYPAIKYIFDFDEHEIDGIFEVGMALSIESFIGSAHGGEGVKLEEQVVITDTGCRKLSSYPIEDW